MNTLIKKIDTCISKIEKAKKYIKPEKGQKPPKGVSIKVGPKKGIYYDTNKLPDGFVLRHSKWRDDYVDVADYSYITEENVALVDTFVLKRLRENTQQLYSRSRKMGNRPDGVFSKHPSAGSTRQKLDIIDSELIKRKRKEQK